MSESDTSIGAASVPTTLGSAAPPPPGVLPGLFLLKEAAWNADRSMAELSLSLWVKSIGADAEPALDAAFVPTRMPLPKRKSHFNGRSPNAGVRCALGSSLLLVSVDALPNENDGDCDCDCVDTGDAGASGEEEGEAMDDATDDAMGESAGERTLMTAESSVSDGAAPNEAQLPSSSSELLE